MSDSMHPPADRHVKIPHLVFGLLFLGFAGIWALGASDLISGERLTILAPAVLIAAGVIGLVASLASGRNRSRAAYPPVERFAAGPQVDDRPVDHRPTDERPTDERPTDLDDESASDDDQTREIR